MTDCFPLIHLNGSSPKALTEALEQANTAVLEAEDALARTLPNMRDFYPKADGQAAFAVAWDQHRADMAALAAIRNRLEETWTSITNQVDDRKASRS